MEEIKWVTARSECSAWHMFQTLKHELKADVAERIIVRDKKGDTHYIFKTDSVGPDVFVVMREGHKNSKSVSFSQTKDEIIVSDNEDQVLFKIGIALNDEGRCVYWLDGEEKQSWQIRKLALDDLFFGKF